MVAKYLTIKDFFEKATIYLQREKGAPELAGETGQRQSKLATFRALAL